MLLKTATGYIKTPYNMGDCYALEHYLSVFDDEKDQYVPYGYIVHDNALYIPNINIERFMKPLGETEVIEIKPNAWKPMSRHYMSRLEPRDALQENVISFITGERMFKQNKKEHQLAIVIPPGKGKAMPMDQILPTPTGMTTMKDLEVGSVLFSKDGKPTKVTEIYDQGKLDVYEVTLNDGRSVECCDDHLFEVFYLDPSKGIINDILPLKEIRKRMNDVGCKYIIPTTESVQYQEAFYPVTDPDIAGVLLGNPMNTYICYLRTDNEMANKIAEKINAKAYFDTDRRRYCFIGFFGRPMSWVKVLKRLKFPATFILSKSIPWRYLCGSADTMTKLLKGLSTSASSFFQYLAPPGTAVFYVGEDESIMRAVAYMVRSRGVVPEIQVKDNIFRVVVNTDNPQQSLTIRDVKYVGQKECRCIKVDHPSHIFLAGDFVVTHNTFTSIYSITNLNRKALIVTHMTKIEDQWVKSMLDMFDYQGDNILRLTTNLMTKAMNGKDLNADVYFVSHQILNHWLSANPPTKLNDVFKTLGIGIKIIDEYHLHWRNSIILDLFTNIDKTVYLTATFGRSKKEEDQLFTRVTENVITYGSSDRSVEERHTEYHPVLYNSKCPFKTVRYMGNGHGMGMKKWVYADWQHINNPNDDANKIILSLIPKCLASEGKVLITVASIKTCDVVADRIRKQYPDENIGVINSSNSTKENDRVKQTAKIIVSTIQSAGTGVDIPKLRYVINVEPFSSKITAEQFLGRLRPYYDDQGEQRTTYLFDLVDTSILYCNIYYKSRSKRISQLAKETQPIQL